MTLYLEQYLDSLQGLPGDLGRNLGALRTRDSETQEKLRELDIACRAYLKGIRSWGKEAKARKYAGIRALFREAKSLADDKVALAATTYEMVDKHIRRLDSDLSRFEHDIKRKFLEGKFGDTDDEAPITSKKNPPKRPRKPDPAPPAAKKKRKGGARKSADSDDDDDDPPALPAATLSSINTAALAELSGPALFQQLAGGGGEVMDMPVDPNEPTYCLCHQVSFGEMVGCDNPHCTVEWFHFACVGLQAKPKGKWFCPKCLDDRKKKAH